MEFKRTEDGRPDKFPVGMRVLAVDDNATCLKSLEVMLLRCKYHVTKTMEPKKAVEMLRENSNMFDLVISDVDMPDTDGFKLLEIGLEMDLPVIMLSAHSDYDSVMKGITHGACDYLIKPVRVEELKNIWKHVVKKNIKSYAKNIGPSRQLLPPSESDNIPSYSKKRKEKVNDDHSDREEDDAEGSGARKKPRVVWPQELHQKFDKKKITWTIKNFSSLPADPIFSDDFFVRGCKWHLKAYPKGKNVADYLSMCLCVADSTTSLPSGWRRRTKCRFTIVNQISHKLSDSYLIELGFDENLRGWGRNSKFPLKVIYAKDSGFLLNGELKIVVEIEVLEVIGKLDVTEETSTITEIVDINGFELSPAQAKSVSRMFERHPEIASEFRPKSSNLKTGYMSLLLSLIETMIQLPQEMSKDDLVDAHVALDSMRNAGFNLDWLKKKLYELSVKKEESSEAGLQGMEEELREIKMKCADMEALVEKKKAKVSVSKAHISFDDIV